MERKVALAVASTATLLLGSTVVATASVTSTSFLGFGQTPHATVARANASVESPAPTVIRKTRDVYDRYVVAIGTDAANLDLLGPPRSALSPPVAAAPAPSQPTSGSTPTPTPTTGGPAPDRKTGSGNTVTTPSTEPDGETPGTSPTTAPRSTTTVPTTPTTRPRGVPRDWPADKPIPPMPPNCREPQLEDNGVWNCDD